MTNAERTNSRNTGYIWHERFGWHDTSTHVGFLPAGGLLQPLEHFESSASKTRMASLIEVSGLRKSLTDLEFAPATKEQILSVHTNDYVDRIIKQSSSRGGDAGDGTSPFGPGSYEIAQMAAGATTSALLNVLDDTVDNSYALVRPPGHHAEPQQGRGFCIFSNVSIAINEARRQEKAHRIAIVDIDVHHGNGAQKIYWNDPEVLTISVHQDRLFPLDSGMFDETGGEDSNRTNINLPLPAGCGNGAYVATVSENVVPALEAFRPEVIIVSCGFDASMADPLGRMCVTAAGYAQMTKVLMSAADSLCDGRLVFSHEGGYSPAYVPFCGLSVVETLAGIDELTPDPFVWAFDEYPVHEVTRDQREAIDRGYEVVRKAVGTMQ
ncbi:class II histone deacetylase [Brevibacterium aurantiacum]|uniref:Class II histone deacetylase n=1 Tax=Brevibacterium aurantiacum TaxID=273384 RepID=A0A556C976_BREAU|nr:class II histone deacetylase [Brevibacterium aurantiacum]TSI13578.1 class II histone deacetylase [Brevibacterium aurantiacum]